MYKLYRKVFEGLPFGALLLKLVPKSGQLEWVVFDVNDRAREEVLELLHIDLHLCEGERIQDVLDDTVVILDELELARGAKAGTRVDLDRYSILSVTRDLTCLIINY